MDDQKAKRIPAESITLQFAGELILPRLPDKNLPGLFRRYEALFEKFANMNRVQRYLNYKMVNGLMLTSFAKKTKDAAQKKQLFELKNKIFLSLANDREARRMLAFKYLTTKNFRVIAFCSECEKKNAEGKTPKHQWKFCTKCKVDRNFYNVLSMHHKFDQGSTTLFLSNDLIPKVRGLKLRGKGDLKDFDEEARFDKYHYNVRNLDAFSLNSVLEMHNRIMK
jgi:hypothetical protein